MLRRDTDKNWFESRVTEVDVEEDPQKIKVPYSGVAWDVGVQGGGENGQKSDAPTCHTAAPG